VSFCKISDTNHPETSFCKKIDDADSTLNNKFTKNSTFATDFALAKPGKWYMYYFPTDNDTQHEYIGSFDTGDQGAVYTMTIWRNKTGEPYQTAKYDLVPPNRVNLAWQVPQYFIISVGEILLSITGYEFSYSQSPKSMKAVVQAAWLFFIAIGDCIVIVVVEAQIFSNQAYIYLLFAGIMLVVIIAFAFMAYYLYEYVSYADEEDDDFDEPPEKKPITDISD